MTMPVIARYMATEPLEESRQHYATVRIQEFQRYARMLSFAQLLRAFRDYGRIYDQGFRLRHLEENAA